MRDGSLELLIHSVQCAPKDWNLVGIRASTADRVKLGRIRFSQKLRNQEGIAQFSLSSDCTTTPKSSGLPQFACFSSNSRVLHGYVVGQGPPGQPIALDIAGFNITVVETLPAEDGLASVLAACRLHVHHSPKKQKQDLKCPPVLRSRVRERTPEFATR